MRVLLLLLVLVGSVAARLRADEGMWLPLLVRELNIKDMQAKGFELTAEDLYSVNQSSLKDAVVQFGGGCTGGVVSAEGLLLTNHHCAYDEIQSLSSVQHDYLTHGYSARSRGEELPCRGLTVKFLVYMEDVTDRVVKGLKPKSSPEQRAAMVKGHIDRLIAERKGQDGGLIYKVTPMFYGNQYYLFAYKEYRDVRLVVAPPSSVGKFGGDTDNWMWPRHTGDFTLLRVYADANNEPADYSESNVPLKTKRHFKINVQERKADDFAMVYGYPGSTQRYLVSDAVEEIMANSNPRKIALRTERLRIMERHMATNDTIRIQYASKHASVANAWKKWQGEASGLRRLNAVGQKQEQEADFQRWVSAGPKARQAEYGGVLERLSDAYYALRPLNLSMDYYRNGLRGIETLGFAAGFRSLDTLPLQQRVDKMRARGEAFFKDYSPAVERELMERMLALYIDEVPMAQQLPSVAGEFGSPGDVRDFTARVMAQSIFTSRPRFEEFVARLEAGEDLSYAADELYVLSTAVVQEYAKLVEEPYRALQGKLEPLYRQYVRGLMERDPEGRYFPDANFTLRVAYGKVEGYQAREAVHYTPFTTLDGLVEKVAAGAHDYTMTERMVKLYRDRDFGRWAVNGSVPSCILASVHTTGGNSGSPTLNARGELIGLNFDRVWEGTMSDVMFDPTKCRNIIVDSRYILFMIDKYAGAGYLLQELTLVE